MELATRKTKNGIAVDIRIYCNGPDDFRICNVRPEDREERFMEKFDNHEARNFLYDLPAILTHELVED